MRGNRGVPDWIAESSPFTGDSSLTHVLIAALGVTNGLLAGAVGYALDRTVLNLHTAVWAFLIVWAATTAYLSYKRVASGVVATGLFSLAVFVLLQPLAVFGPSWRRRRACRGTNGRGPRSMAGAGSSSGGSSPGRSRSVSRSSDACCYAARAGSGANAGGTSPSRTDGGCRDPSTNSMGSAIPGRSPRQSSRDAAPGRSRGLGRARFAVVARATGSGDYWLSPGSGVTTPRNRPSSSAGSTSNPSDS